MKNVKQPGWLCPFKRRCHPPPHAKPPTCRSVPFVCTGRTCTASQPSPRAEGRARVTARAHRCSAPSALSASAALRLQFAYLRVSSALLLGARLLGLLGALGSLPLPLPLPPSLTLRVDAGADCSTDASVQFEAFACALRSAATATATLCNCDCHCDCDCHSVTVTCNCNCDSNWDCDCGACAISDSKNSFHILRERSLLFFFCQ